ncbi:Transcriptional regulator [Pseudomonas viridiflava]|uniref:AraC family transcriptional regulator n=4 Tax=Pseudomonas TaxID=286 RepID=A0A7Z6Y317_PSESF|nr:AraC family transcriptional regulator [Pseudomonas syringae pv. persicae]RMP82531.1 AraC family transcriptional regulator [Pseudomonas syringae pv. actinidiae]RMQ14731.1 Transcriptional regulator [Pseudomonas viridiflava]RMQ69261.1 Transcriptional regulator [Pseudomonas viridiflava]RMR57430.1 AraC family transcriptional regulator [Pseudomonas syringae pv. actinidiae]
MIDRPELEVASMQAPSNDPISELLLGMRLFGVQFRRLEVVPPLGVGFTNAIGRAQFHFVGRGPVWLRSAENVLYKLDTGDAVLIPRGGHHAMLTIESTSASDVQRFDPSTGISDGVQDRADAGEGAAVDQAIIFSCCMELELGGMQPLVAAMPDVMQVSTLLETCPELRPMLEAMEREALMLQAGHAGILARLAEVVAALLVRGWVAGGCGNATGWLGALQDPRLSRAIVMMHQHPGRRWTVATLAHEARHSRSVFAQRFLEATGKPPLQYLTELRMRLALHSLSREQHSVEAVANQLGYGSLAAFSRAFKRTVGISPGAVRAAKSVDG